jgi:hypothetical protein
MMYSINARISFQRAILSDGDTVSSVLLLEYGSMDDAMALY